ncbi:succinate dehydrogenase, cytochrome b556 subunit [Granulosicoccaceae sp. 1_MG-2023]|nr:succinate dehydrogenase, cytochrome b556 subunit [Granulosicoccaceae sp. 1_MG-2023]
MSPHLQIYKLPLTALLSITHRITGVGLSAGTLFLVWALVAAASGPESFATVQAVMSSWIGYLILICFTLALYFHFCNGIRHMLWDIGKGLDLESTKKTGPAVLIVALVLTVLTWLVAFAAG